MQTLEEQITETWNIHQRSMMLLMEHIPEEGYKSTLSKRGGRDVARQLAHIHNVRVWRLKSFAKKNKFELSELDNKTSYPKTDLLKHMEQSGKVMKDYIEHILTSDGKVSNFKRGLVPMIGYYISHEAHHRGHLLLTIKECGIKRPDELKWGIWDWNKI